MAHCITGSTSATFDLQHMMDEGRANTHYGGSGEVHCGVVIWLDGAGRSAPSHMPLLLVGQDRGDGCLGGGAGGQRVKGGRGSGGVCERWHSGVG